MKGRFDDALYNAAGSDDHVIDEGSFGNSSARRTSDSRRIARTRNILLRFFENIDGDVCVAEIVEVLELPDDQQE